MDNRLLLKATQARLEGNYADALPLFDAFTADNPLNALAQAGAAECLHMLGKYDEAFSQAIRATDLDAQLALPHVTRAYVYVHRGEHDKALEEAAISIQLEPTSPDALQCYGTLTMLLSDKIEEGISFLERAVEVRPNSVFAHRNLAHGYLQSKNGPRYLYHTKTIFRLRPSLRTAIDLMLAYSTRYSAILALGVCLTILLASISRSKALLLIPLFYIVYTLWIAILSARRRDWPALKGAIILALLVGIPSLFVLLR